ncbi:MAG: N-acetyl-gamma-glutamyl-phosphate reductase [Alphaproteobacteria bacterium]|nr:N-acetyl-gamma-glutamyl-phosphate reductase [Alphaproteobacteria bacterium]|tara:strand:+ start:2142 stop:3155 length:1014 start_codon:yes stop_codon:yes gene_type:complete
MKFRINAAILGSTGYTGIELIRLLSFHKKVEIKYLISKSNYGKEISDFYPGLNFKNYPKLIKFNQVNWKEVDVIFLCLPTGESKKIITKIPKNICVIDLSNDFRVNSLTKGKWVYGIADHIEDFIHYNNIEKNETKIANPGCYPTSILSPLIPLLKERYIKTSDIIIDSKSGITGAGKKSVTENLFSEVSNSIKPYKIGEHKHLAEIEKCISKYSNGKKVKISFTPHVIPVNRGISSNIYVSLEKGKNIRNIKKLFEKKTFTFLKILKKNQIPTIKDVVGTNYCFFNIFPDRIKGRIIIISVIDNLIKGAAGQAIHNMNLIYKFKENEGLEFNPISI